MSRRGQGVGIAPTGVSATVTGVGQTVGSASASLATVAIPNNSTQFLKAYVMGVDPNNPGVTAIFEIGQVFQNVNGVVSPQGTVSAPMNIVNAVLSGAAATFAVSGSSVTLQATGIALGGRTINWTSRLNVMLTSQP